MFRRGCVATCIFAFLLIGVAGAGADPTRERKARRVPSFEKRGSALEA